MRLERPTHPGIDQDFEDRQGNTMSEVDRLSTSGTYPALALTDRRRRDESQTSSTGTDARGSGRNPGQDPVKPEAGLPGARPDALIDEYA